MVMMIYQTAYIHALAAAAAYHVQTDQQIWVHVPYVAAIIVYQSLNRHGTFSLSLEVPGSTTTSNGDGKNTSKQASFCLPPTSNYGLNQTSQPLTA